MAIGLEDGSASRNATLGTAGAIWPLRPTFRRESRGSRPTCRPTPAGPFWGAGKLFGGHQLGPWTGFAVLCGYAVVLTGLAAWRLRRLSTRKGCDDTSMSVWTPVENPGTRPPCSQAFDIE
jgi:hypothetical protein